MLLRLFSSKPRMRTRVEEMAQCVKEFACKHEAEFESLELIYKLDIKHLHSKRLQRSVQCSRQTR